MTSESLQYTYDISGYHVKVITKLAWWLSHTSNEVLTYLKETNLIVMAVIEAEMTQIHQPGDDVINKPLKYATKTTMQYIEMKLRQIFTRTIHQSFPRKVVRIDQ